MAHHASPLGDLSPADFLARYWQRQPLLIRGALPGFSDPLSPDELAGLACEDEVNARIILERDGMHPWEVRHGPFADTDFADLPQTHWTLLVQDVNRYVPALAELLDRFDFLPGWRVDDVMVSYAPEYGSVGPHVDEYDVFLVQGLGQRRWQINPAPVNAADLIPDLELGILRHFQPTETWVLEPGDMLYLPPGVAHYGVALGDCMTYSIGFRAPTHADMLSAFVEHQIATRLPHARYGDAGLPMQTHCGAITPATLARVAAIIRDLPMDEADIANWFGRFITQPTSDAAAPPPERPYNVEQLRQALAQASSVHRSEYSRFAYIDHDTGATLFVDGEAIQLPPPQATLVPLLCDRRRYPPDRLVPFLEDAACAPQLVEWFNRGWLYIPSP